LLNGQEPVLLDFIRHGSIVEPSGRASMQSHISLSGTLSRARQLLLP
jgi:hypothetical protein